MSRTGRASSARRGVMAGLCSLLVLTIMLLCLRASAQNSDGAGQDAAGAPAPASEEPTPELTLPAAPREAPFDKSRPPEFLETTAGPGKQTRPPPTHLQQAALQELEREVKRFTKIGGSYRETIDVLLRREYLRKRYAEDQTYARQIKAEEELEDKARLAAIALFERFIAKYPNDPEYTPDAMFRLGELYFERDAILQQQAQEQFLIERDKLAETQPEGAEEPPPVAEPKKDFNATVELYRRLVRNFPNYPKVDGVYYLIGYCLNEMGNTNEARLAWLNLVCANRYQYTGEEIPNDLAELPEQPDPAIAHPALNLIPTPEAPTKYNDPYADCKPAVVDSKFFAETWLRIGEYHFDFDYTQHGLSRAISAYKNVLTRPDDRNYNLALYKVAWAYYRASRYPEALEHFWKLLQWSEDERQRTGRGSELREEAIQYLGIGFAYDDWNENQVPDPQEGQQTGIERVQNPALLPQDKPWTVEVFHRLGYVFFDEAKYPEAVKIWEIALKRWPNDPEAPEIQNMIARAYTRHNEADLALAARAKLGKYAEGSEWWEANKDHPVEQRRAEELAEEALIGAAINHHQRAQSLRRSCVEQQDLDLCQQAQAEYRLAATAYRGYIDHYPNSPQAYELQYNLADTLYWSESYEDAAKEYAAVRDSNLDDTHLSTAARLVVESIRQLVDQQVKAGKLQLRTEPPEATGTPPEVSPVPMPALLQRLASARETYLARVDDAHDAEKVRDSYFYNNTLLLYQYGYWDLARSRLLIIYDEHCKGPNASEIGQIAWYNLRNMAVELGRAEEVRQLGKDLEVRQCTFSPEPTATVAIDCGKPENKDKPRCLAGADITNLRYRDAVDIFESAERASGDEQRRLYERAASQLVKAVNDEPGHPQAPLALEKAAIALERTSRFESAARLFQRIIDEVGPKKGADAEEQKLLDAILGNAYFRLAYNSNRFFDFDRAIENYRVLADSDRFAKSDNPAVVESREGALINSAKILEYRQQYERAATYFKRVADSARDPNEKRAAAFRVAEMSFKLKQWARAEREMKAFIDRYKADPEAGGLIVEAYARIAEARKQQRLPVDAAMRDIVDAFAKSGQEPGSYPAELAAQAQFTLVDKTAADFEKFAIKPGKPATMNAYVETLTTQITNGGKEAKTKAEAYNAVLAYKRPSWTIAAFVRQGRIYEILTRAILNAPFVVPADLAKQLKALPEENREEVQITVEDRIRQLLDQQVRPIECLAVARYALASRAGRVGNLDNEYTREATDRITAYGDERIAECVGQAAATDPTFAAYVPGEFTRAPRGLTLDIEPGVAPPSVKDAR